MMPPGQIGPSSGFYPMVHLADRDWDRVIRALRARDDKRDAELANKVERSVQASRLRRLAKASPDQ